MNGKIELQVGGWIKTDSSKLFGRLSDALNFSLKNEPIITPSAPAIVYDFEYLRGTTRREPQLEFLARKIFVNCFRKHFPSETCTFIDVNHACFEFVPEKINLGPDYEPWPYDLIPGSAYIALNNGSFTTGVFSDWRSLRLMIYGESLVKEMIQLFPMVPMETHFEQ